jgi:chitosanase
MAKTYGVKTALGQAIIWDTYIQHGEGGTDGTAAVLKETKAAMGGNVNGNESAWISKFLDNRLNHLLNWSEDNGMSQGDTSSKSRVAALRSLVSGGKWNLDAPLQWSVYGDSFSITK